MKHLCELSLSEFYAAIESPTWVITEKLDGSFIRAGIDESGRYYTLRKSSAIYYSIDDWPDLAWANYFRNAHVALEQLVIDLHDNNCPNEPFHIDVEIIAGSLPNSINYSAWRSNSLVITGSSHDLRLFSMYGMQPIHGRLVSRLPTIVELSASTKFWYSTDGKSLETTNSRVLWSLKFNAEEGFFPAQNQSMIQFTLMDFLAGKCYVGKYLVSKANLLEVKLTQRPDFVPEDDWKENRKAIVSQLKAAREQAKQEFEHRCNLFTNQIMVQRAGGLIEGFVVNTDTTKGRLVFKLVDKRVFASLNNFTHIVRYWLQGGRRPERPCFLSRTKDWPVEKRLARLETLRLRFLRHHYKMVYKIGLQNYLTYAHPELRLRTLTLFAEIRERIINGRNGV